MQYQNQKGSGCKHEESTKTKKVQTNRETRTMFRVAMAGSVATGLLCDAIISLSSEL